MTELILGTAQFGTAYGITNSQGRLSDNTVADILQNAWKSGITAVDTAADYGDAQERLGRLAPQGMRHFTKLSFPTGDLPLDESQLFTESSRTLRTEVLEGVLFHRVADLDDLRLHSALAQLRAARDKGMILKIGVSIYDSVDLERALTMVPDLDLLQLPASIIDHRLLSDVRVDEFRRRGGTVHVRSVFLQGVLLSDAADLPPFFAPLAPALRELARVAAEHSTTVSGLALGHMRDHHLVDGVIVGATRVSELQESVDAWRQEPTDIGFLGADVSDAVLDPRRWPAAQLPLLESARK